MYPSLDVSDRALIAIGVLAVIGAASIFFDVIKFVSFIAHHMRWV